MIKYYVLFISVFILEGCFTKSYGDKYNLTGKEVVVDLETLPIGKVGESYSVNINIQTPIELSGIYGKFYDTEGALLRSGMIEKAEKVEATHSQMLKENLSWTKEFINPQGLEFQLIQRYSCAKCDDEKYSSSQLIISGIPKKAGIYDFHLQVRFIHPYFMNIFYRLEVLP